MKARYLTFLIFTAMTTALFAQDFNFDNVTLSGNGCPTGSYSVILSPDQKAASILFDQFLVAVPDDDGDPRTPSYMNLRICDIFVAAALAEGERVSGIDISVDFRGAIYAEDGAEAMVKTLFMQWTGPSHVGTNPRNVIAERNWKSGSDDFVDESYEIHQSLSVATGNSQCARGHDRKLSFVLKNMLLAKLATFPSVHGLAQLSLDSADFSGSIRMRIRTQSCGVPPGHAGNPPVGGHYNPTPATPPAPSVRNPPYGSHYNPTPGNGHNRGGAPRACRPGNPGCH